MPVQVYSFYIFDRHTECIYTKLWISPPPLTPSSAVSSPNPGAHPSTPGGETVPAAPGTSGGSDATMTAQQQQQQPGAPAGAPVPPGTSGSTATTKAPGTQSQRSRGLSTVAAARRLAAGDDAKLIFGAVFSLRNMVRKLGGDDDAFISYRTAQYKLHYYETPSSLRFAMLTEPGAPGMRNVLHQIYINLWVEYVVKNPLAPVEHKRGDGVRNEMFEMGLDKFVRGLM